eukprot:12695.XXX_117927_118591_1 [CDS] Oithona nana genome sequencing.
MGSQDNLDSQIYDVVMIAMTILGVVVNITAIIILQRKNRCSMFHSLLKILAAYDLIVIVGCTTLYAENFKFYVLAFTLGPLLFYLPKFFEIRTETTLQAYTKTLNCTEVLDSTSSIFNEHEW